MENRHKNRETLKAYFRKGSVPTEEQFAQFIDSVPNIGEEGLVTVTAADGMRLFPAASGAAATLFAEESGREGAAPLWRLTLGADGALEICDGGGEPVLKIDRERNVTVPGTLKAAKFLSDESGEETSPAAETLDIRADGLWHSLPVESAAGRSTEGFRVYRISACYWNLRSGACTVCEVLASHSGGRRRRVRSARRHWWGWSGHIRVRWQRSGGKLYLRISSKGVSSGSERIRCRVETLWEL